jgi:hypothetical protein
MVEPDANAACRHERIADLEHETEDRMHVTADMLSEPQRSKMHGRADALSRRARRHRETAERLRDADNTPGSERS